METLKKIWDFIISPYTKYKEHKAFKKRMEELRKRDPFIYK
jgi:hypothetical protein|tara:strand:+ start:3347 stop:3469 length:123 start_codon:yes stop_codon:yes gene_type:complete